MRFQEGIPFHGLAIMRDGSSEVSCTLLYPDSPECRELAKRVAGHVPPGSYEPIGEVVPVTITVTRRNAA